MSRSRSPRLAALLRRTSIGWTDVIQAAHSLRFSAPWPVQPLAHAELELTGPAGAVAVLGIGAAPTSFAAPGVLGQILIGAPYLVVPLGVVGGGGTLQATFVAPPILPGAEAGVWWTQSLMITPIGGAVPGSPVTWVVVP